MQKFKLIYDPDMEPRLPFQTDLHHLAKDLDRMVIEKDSITEVTDWVIRLVQKVYPGAEVLGPVTRKGGAVIFLGDTGEIQVKPVNP